ncbi:PREDICTED: SET and MYND domain-containing protein 5-like [Priapulus caudatus]|uniref:Protein-lysine N-trimethyltransferase SMYD5 n=1 Tax=Priapulus caudatus TaxID=37621 RepID=A0ABM1EU50_PRICU|nr:PREDICTED: SET and MYND domain-containing protein 5-like [Priapulus caudatus]
MAAPNKCFEVRVLPDKGRCLFATHDIREGEHIFEEEPIASCQFLWNAFYQYRACDHCMKPLETAEQNARRLTANPELTVPHADICTVETAKHVACQRCQVQYCSKECKEKAWRLYHRILCKIESVDDPSHPLIVLKESWRNVHFPPETANIMLIARMAATVKQALDKENLLTSLFNLTTRTFNFEDRIAHKLLGEKFQEQIEYFRNVLASQFCDADTQQWFTPEGFRSILALIATNGQGVGTSALSAYVHKCDTLDLPAGERKQLDAFIDKLYEDIDRETGPFLNCEGSGVYLLQSAANHSCIPNAEITFPNNNHVLCLIATTSINANEEICISYLDECARGRSRHSRQKTLREYYLFNCDCAKCAAEADQQDVTSDEEDEEEDVGCPDGEEGDDDVEESFS